MYVKYRRSMTEANICCLCSAKATETHLAELFQTVHTDSRLLHIPMAFPPVVSSIILAGKIHYGSRLVSSVLLIMKAVNSQCHPLVVFDFISDVDVYGLLQILKSTTHGTELCPFSLMKAYGISAIYYQQNDQCLT